MGKIITYRKLYLTIKRLGLDVIQSAMTLDVTARSEKHPVSTILHKALQLGPLIASVMKPSASISSFGSIGLRERSISVSPCRPLRVAERAARPSQPKSVERVKRVKNDKEVE